MRNSIKRLFDSFMVEEDGMGVVEVILIIVVLISLVIIFKSQITSLVNSIIEHQEGRRGSLWRLIGTGVWI